jgi:hypothetical protein
MAIQFAVATRNARLNAVETEIGASPILKIRTGAAPSDCAAADSGDCLATMTLPADYMLDAAAGVKAKSGTWQDLLADAAGVAGHFRIYDSGGVVCHIQGSCSLPGAGGDMVLINTNIAINQPITVDTFTLTDGNS